MIARKRTRPGFTLPELLVVIVIIAVAVALFTGAAQRVRVTQMVHTSSTTVAKLQEALDDQHQAILSQVQKDRENKSGDFQTLLTHTGDPDRAQALLAYCRVRQAFPQTLAEVQASSFSVGGVTFARPKHFDALAAMTGGSPEEVAAALLYAIASKTGTGGVTFTGQATESVEMDIDVGGVRTRVYKDAFSRPIAFYRFGLNTELQAPPYVNPKDTYRDPHDPLGKLTNWGNTQAKTAAAQVLFVPGGGANASTFGTENRFPIVYSAGQNKQYEALDFTKDDILGYRLRKIGQKGDKR